MPDLYILTGSNGAGKSTTGHFYLPEHINDRYEIFDGDKLFMQKRLLIYKNETPSIKEAARMAREWLFEELKIVLQLQLKTTLILFMRGIFLKKKIRLRLKDLN